MNSDMNFKPADEIKPYPGLRCFQYKENYLFFGREGKAQEIASRLQHSHFVAVVGTSGSGKSSLVRAGLLPLLYGGMLYESGSHWRIAIMRPEETPIHNLAEALTYPVDFEAEEQGDLARDENQIAMTEATLRRSGVGLLDFINNPANDFDADENLLVVVDQFEELFRFKEKSSLEDTEEAAAFVKLLLEATRDKKGRIFVVITMRSDFLGDCAEFRDLPEAINDGQYLIPRMTRDQLRQSIESPALVGDAQVSPALVNRLLNDLEDQNQSIDLRDRTVNDHLPVLQHALMRTWDLWKETGAPDKSIDIEHYDNEQIGGMAHALSRHADEAFNELSAPQKIIAERMFKCLTETDAENRETRRPTRIEEICAVTDADEAEAFKIIEVFRQEGRTFLMPPPSVKLSAETKIDISHESLIRNWELLKGWVKDEAENARQYHRVSEDALLLREYEENNRNILTDEEIKKNCKDFLWRGIELKDALKWRDEFKPNVAWTSRYQALTEKEKRRLDELSRISPAKEKEIRRQFMQNHFTEVMTFLDKSAENELAKQAEQERNQQERLAYEREKALAAEQLAEVERANAESLQNFNDSLKRQRKILSVVSVFSIFLMLASIILAVYALQKRETANLEKGRAEESLKEADAQKRLAEKNLEEADAQRKFAKEQEDLAKDNAVKATEQKELAKQNEIKARQQAELAKKNEGKAKEQAELAKENEGKAEAQKKLAESNLAEANKQKEIADSEKQKADNERKLNEDNLTALSAFENSNYETAALSFKDLLDRIDEKDKKSRWWLHYNLAKTYHQSGNYKEANANFAEALKLVSGAGGNTGSVSFKPVSFFPQSDDSSNAGNDDLVERRITTLRRHAQFYRNCAVTPEDCYNQDSSDNPTPVLLYQRAISMYEQVLKLKKPVDDQRALLNEINDRVDLADTNLALGQILKDTRLTATSKRNFTSAENNYKRAIEIIRELPEVSKPLFIISVQKKLLTAALYQNDMQKADKYARDVLDERGKSLETVEKEALPYEIKMVDTYKDLAKIYRDYKQKLIEYGEERINSVRKRADYKLDVMYRSYVPEVKIDQSDKISNPDTFEKIAKLREIFNANAATDEQKALTESLNELENLLKLIKTLSDNYSTYAESTYVPADDEIARLKPEEQRLWLDLAKDSKFISTLMRKESIFTTTALIIKRIAAGASLNVEENFDAHYLLATLYAEDNDCRAALVIAKADTLVNEHYHEDISNAERIKLRLNSLKQIAEFYESKLGNYEKSAEAGDNYRKVLTEAGTAFLDKLTSFSSRREYFRYYKDAGIFLYKKGGSDNYSKAIDMFKEYSDFLRRSESNLEENKGIYDWGRERVFLERVKVDVLTGLIYEKQAKAREAAELYKNLLADMEKRASLKQKPVTNQNNANVPNANANNASVANANTSLNSNRSVNANINRNSNVNMRANTNMITGRLSTNVTAQTNPYSSTEPLVKDAMFLEAYLRTRLAALYLSRGENEAEALQLLDEKSRAKFPLPYGVSYPLYSVELYASALVTIGDFIRTKRQNNQLAAQSYQRAAEALTYVDFLGRNNPAEDTENYIFSTKSAVEDNYSTGLTKEFYNEYIRALTGLKDSGGTIDDFDKTIADAEKNKNEAPSAGKEEMLKCK